ncbi:DUF2059 domain-containing protein [Roseovarius ramblicola]|uniref:DUF2059 domain-containing protein n=1 Tax=Roseovarius ramblicola TaxID=2022336 RepID=A0ABV5HZC2_9RHOB
MTWRNEVARLRGLVAVLVSAAFVASVFVAPARATERDRLVAFLEVTGFGVAIDSIAQTAEDAPAMIGMTPQDFGPAWSRIAGEVFDSALMRDMALDMLEETLDVGMLGHAAAFYASDLGQRLVEVENASHMQRTDEDAREEAEARAAALPPERRAALARMNAAIDAGGMIERAMREIQVRFLLAAADAGLTEDDFDADMLRRLLTQGAGEARAEMREAALVSAARTYRSLPTDDLRAYALALEHPVMARVYELMNAVQFEIMANRFEALATRLGEVPPARDL